MHELRITYMVHACMHACKPCALKQWPGRSVMYITLLTAVEENRGIVHYNKGNMKLLDHFNPTSLRVVISFERQLPVPLLLSHMTIVADFFKFWRSSAATDAPVMPVPIISTFSISIFNMTHFRTFNMTQSFPALKVSLQVQFDRRCAGGKYLDE